MFGGTNVFAVIFAFDGQFWLRISAQIYNDLDDMKRLADVVRDFLDRSEIGLPAELQNFSQLPQNGIHENGIRQSGINIHHQEVIRQNGLHQNDTHLKTIHPNCTHEQRIYDLNGNDTKNIHEQDTHQDTHPSKWHQSSRVLSKRDVSECSHNISHQ